MSDTGRENDPFAAFESDRTVIKPGAGRGASPAGTGGAPGGGRGGAPGRGAGRRRAWTRAAARRRRSRSTR